MRILARLHCVCLAAIVGSLQAQSPRPAAEVRGVWIPNTGTTFFDSRDDIVAGMQALADGHVNVVFPVVWSKGFTLFRSATLEQVIGKPIDPRYAGRDPLAEVVFEAHRHGIEVIPWFEYGFTAGHRTTGSPVLDARPGWAAIGQDGEPVVKNGFSWMNPMDPELQAFVAQMVLEVCAGYDVDGVQGDDRLPAMPCEAGYDKGTVAEWRKQFHRPPPDDIHDAAWTKWRADRLTDFLAKLRAAVKDAGRDLVFSMAPGAPGWSYREYLQDPETWIARGLVDALHPQAYARDRRHYDAMLDQILGVDWIARQRDVLSPGVLVQVGSFVTSPEILVGDVQENRRRKLAGAVFFYHQALLDHDAKLLHALVDGPYATPARLPWRNGDDWRPPAVQAQRKAGATSTGDQVWTIVPPVAGRYRVFVALPADTPSDASVVVRLAGSTDARTVNVGRASSWLPIGTVTLSAGGDEPVVTVEARPDALHVNAVIALVDRRAR